MTTDYDVAVIGAGPAGAAIACYLARAGLSVAVFESETFPRPHVGESLVPATTPVLQEIGAMELVDAAGFPKKYGAAWTSAESRCIPHNGFTGLDHDFRAAEVMFVERDQPGITRDFTYHVDRGKFDLILFKHAESLGAHMMPGVNVLRVDFDRDPSTVTVEARVGPRSIAFTAGMVVDASGRRTVLGRQLRLKVPDPVFNQYAIHSWFEDVDRSAIAITNEKADYIHVHFLPLTDSWIWQIPITDSVTSVGVVTQKHQFAAAGSSREDFFWQYVSSRPDLLGTLKKAQRLRPLKAEGDYSYSMRAITGDRFVLIGDAARFVDPIFSSGVSVALNSARLAARDIIAAHAAGDYTAARFAPYRAKLRRATANWHEFISIYYRLNVLFTAFVQDPRYRIDVLKMLQGDFYDEEEPRALGAMRETLATVESDPAHLWRPYLGTLAGHGG